MQLFYGPVNKDTALDTRNSSLSVLTREPPLEPYDVYISKHLIKTGLYSELVLGQPYFVRNVKNLIWVVLCFFLHTFAHVQFPGDRVRRVRSKHLFMIIKSLLVVLTITQCCSTL